MTIKHDFGTTVPKSKKERLWDQLTLYFHCFRECHCSAGAVCTMHILVTPESTQGIRSPGQGTPWQPSSHGTDRGCYWLAHTIILCMFLVTQKTALVSPQDILPRALRTWQRTFLPNKWQRPGEDIHEIWEPVWVGRTVELPDVHHVVLVLQHCSWNQNNTGGHQS